MPVFPAFRIQGIRGRYGGGLMVKRWVAAGGGVRLRAGVEACVKSFTVGL